MAHKHAHMRSTTYVACTSWLQRHGAWYDLPYPRASTKTPKDLCIESVGEAMSTIPWFDWALDMQMTQTHDAYARRRGAMPYARGRNS